MKRARRRKLKKGQVPSGRWKAPALKSKSTIDKGLLQELGYQRRAKSIAIDQEERLRIFRLFGIDLSHPEPPTEEELETEAAHWSDITLSPDRGARTEVHAARQELKDFARGVRFEHHVALSFDVKMFFEESGPRAFLIAVTPGICAKRSILYSSRAIAKAMWLAGIVTWEKTFVRKL